MSRYVITADPDTPLNEIVALFEVNHIRRVPIVENDKIIGIVSQADFLKVLTATADRIVDTMSSADDAVGEDLLARLNEHSWLRTDLINITIHDGVVSLWGIVGSDAERSAVRVVAEACAGVHTVNDYLMIRTTAFENSSFGDRGHVR
jgi:CBS-domain-containing membrane protein